MHYEMSWMILDTQWLKYAFWNELNNIGHTMICIMKWVEWHWIHNDMHYEMSWLTLDTQWYAL